MYLSQRHGFALDDQGHLVIGGMRAADLAGKFGTPLYVIDEARMRANCRAYLQAMRDEYPGPFRVIFASKSLCTVASCQVAYEEGLGIDVVSAGEILTALTAGVPAGDLFFHGSNKTPEEIAYGLDVGVGRFVVDNEHELDLLDRMARQRGRRVDILLRVTPGIEPHTHRAIQTGGVDSKFGFGLLGPYAESAVRRALGLSGVRLRGLHCHIGSQILNLAPFAMAARSLVSFAAEMRGSGFSLEELNMGGGLGIRYLADQDPPSPSDHVRVISEVVRDLAARYRMSLPTMMIEPGRAIVGSAGVTLYTAGAIKTISGVRRYVSVDGGMYENPRPALYGAQYEAVVATRSNEEPTSRVSIAGRCCEAGDVLIWDAHLPEVAAGDLLAVFSTGAYNYSMASNYNRYPRPALVFVRDGEAHIAVERESPADMVRLDRALPRRTGKPPRATQEGGEA